MPYYVYALHRESKLSCLCGAFEDYHAAEICEREKQKTDHSQKTFVILIYAENKTHADEKIKKIRRERTPWV